MLICGALRKHWVIQEIMAGKPLKIRILRAGYWDVTYDYEALKQ